MTRRSKKPFTTLFSVLSHRIGSHNSIKISLTVYLRDKQLKDFSLRNFTVLCSICQERSMNCVPLFMYVWKLMYCNAKLARPLNDNCPYKFISLFSCSTEWSYSPREPFDFVKATSKCERLWNKSEYSRSRMALKRREEGDMQKDERKERHREWSRKINPLKIQ